MRALAHALADRLYVPLFGLKGEREAESCDSLHSHPPAPSHRKGKGRHIDIHAFPALAVITVSTIYSSFTITIPLTILALNTAVHFPAINIANHALCILPSTAITVTLFTATIVHNHYTDELFPGMWRYKGWEGG